MAIEAIQPTRGFDWWRLLPPYWFQNEPTDRVWDAALNKALDRFVPRMVSRYTCEVGPFTVWVSNWAYAYGYRYVGTCESLPLVRTRRRLRRMLNNSDGAILARELAATLARNTGENGNG